MTNLRDDPATLPRDWRFVDGNHSRVRNHAERGYGVIRAALGSPPYLGQIY